MNKKIKNISLVSMICFILVSIPFPSFAKNIPDDILSKAISYIVSVNNYGYHNFAIVDNSRLSNYTDYLIIHYDHYLDTSGIGAYFHSGASGKNGTAFTRYLNNSYSSSGYGTTGAQTVSHNMYGWAVYASSQTYVSRGSGSDGYYPPSVWTATHHFVRNANGTVSISPISATSSFEGSVTLPSHDGYKDNGKTFSFWQWYQLPSGVDSSDLDINVYVDNKQVNDSFHSPFISLHSRIPNTNRWNLNLSLTVYDYGVHTYRVDFVQRSNGKKLGSLSRTFEALEGFIDEDGDGLDDRTGQPPYEPLLPPGAGGSPEWDGTIVGFFRYIIDGISYYIELLVSGIRTTIQSVGKVPQLLSEILILPSPLNELLVFGVITSIIVGIFKR